MSLTIKYGDLIDRGLITPADLPHAWAGFPSITLPVVGDVSFTDAFYKHFQYREIGADNIPTFLGWLESVTLDVVEMLPDGIYHNLLGAAVTVEADEERTRTLYAAPNGVVSTAYATGAEHEKITRKREYESELERAEHLLADGKPLVVWIIERYENCFLGVF